MLQRYLIENEENSAYLALDDVKYRIADHARSAILQQAIKLFDKSKLNIESIFDELLQTNEEQIQKIHAYLFMLDKSALLDAKNALLSQDLLTEAHVIWLMEQPNQQTASRCLKLLTSANMLKGHEHWQSKLSSLSSAEADDLTNLEHKCQRLISSKERQEVKESTIQIWLEPLLRNQGHTHKKQ